MTPILSNGIVASLFAVTADESPAWAADIEYLCRSRELRPGTRGPVPRRAPQGPGGGQTPIPRSASRGTWWPRPRTTQGGDAETVADLLTLSRRGQVTLSRLAQQLGYPRYPDPLQNPLRLPAELPLTIYLTTSPHYFLEWELARTGSRTPETALFYWHDGLRSIPSVFNSARPICSQIGLGYNVEGPPGLNSGPKVASI